MTQMNTSAALASEPLRVYMILSYDVLRFGMFWFTALFPVVVWMSGWKYTGALPGSLSAYYWLADTEPNWPRTIFVGGLLAFAVFFLLHRGFSRKENIALNLAAFCAAGVALIPKTHGEWHHGIAHTAFAVSLYFSLAYVVWFRAKDTFEELEKSGEAPTAGKGSLAWYKRYYRIAGRVMAASPVIAVLLDLVFNKWLKRGDPNLGKLGTIIFFVECIGIWAFSAYWYLKRSELRQAAGIEQLLKQARKAERAT